MSEVIGSKINVKEKKKIDFKSDECLKNETILKLNKDVNGEQVKCCDSKYKTNQFKLPTSNDNIIICIKNNKNNKKKL